MTHEELAKEIFRIVLREPKKGYIPSDLIKIEKIKDLLDAEYVSNIPLQRYMLVFTAYEIIKQPPFQLYNRGTRTETRHIRKKIPGTVSDIATEESIQHETTYMTYVDASDEKHINRALKTYFREYNILQLQPTSEVWPELQASFANKTELGVK